MSYVKKSQSPGISSETVNIKNDRSICEQHGFPMLKISGRLQCVFEYLHDCVVHKQVVDMIRRGKTTYYVFEDGHQLPLLCSCCGGSLGVEDLLREREKVSGRQLEQLYIDTNRLPNGDEIEELILVFLGEQEEQQSGLEVPVAFEVAAKLRHPADCSQKGLPLLKKTPPQKKSSRKKRRRK